MVAEVEVTRFVPTEDQYAWTFGGYDPVLRVRPGQILDLFTEVCPDGEYSKSLYGDDEARYDGLHFSDHAADVIVDRLVAPAVLSVTGRSAS